MNFKLESLLTVAASALLVGTLITSCKDTEYPTPQPVTTAPNTSARVLFANATGDATALTAYLENLPVGSALALGQATNYVTVPYLGSLQLRVKGVGGTLGANDLSNKSTVAANGAYTVFVTDSINRPVVRNAANLITDVGGARLSFVTDPLTQTLTAGSGGVRFFHFVADAGLPASSTATTPLALSVRLSNVNSTSATAITPFNGRVYRNVATTAFTSVPAGTYLVEVVTGATAPTSGTVSAITSTTLTVEAAKLYTLYAQGLARRRTVSVGRIQHN
ncbi:hypothetical protein [uncultured Fibrella sp.]|uniref:hypothetical protein n=1 Tax=uncultured Fibrella sp. TaxID=1284596 RepID=UPI0035C968A0